MKRFYTLWVVLLVLSSLLLSTYVQANGAGNDSPEPATWMPDANLRNAVRDALRLNANEPLTQQKLLNLKNLSAPWLGITDLTGLEYATHLRSLSVGRNQISDLTPLSNLTGLRALYIGGNAISDINPLAHLTNLQRLGMLWNQITDIHILADLVNLTYLRLAGNPITDTSSLGNLPSLSDVDIEIPSLIPDANLRTAAHAALGIDPNLRITIDAMRSLTILNAAQLGIMDLTGLEYATNLRSLAVGGNQISDLTPLSNLTGLRALYIGGNPISDINPLAHLTDLRRLGMPRNQITDIHILADLVNLTYLRLEGNPITDTSPLGNLPSLSDVDIEIPSLIRDANLRTAVHAALGIDPNLRITRDALRSLTTLNAAQLGITDLTGLEHATNLRSLSVGGNQISDLTPLANLIELTDLYIGNNLISDINPLANLTNLRRLEMLENQVADITVLAGLVNLAYLRLAGNPITNPCPLESLPNLSDVDIEISSFIPDTNLRAAVRTALGMEASACITIEGMPALTTLNASQLGITDLTGLEHATNLTHLYIGDNLISDIAPLAGLTHLRVLSIGGNPMSDLTPLSNLSRLTELSIANNMVSDISALANLGSLKRFVAGQNSISDIGVLAGLVNLAYLRLAGNPIRDVSPLRRLPKLTDVDVHVYSPPQTENIQRRSEPTPIDIAPSQDDGQQKDDRREDNSGQSQQQANVNPSTTNPQPQQPQQPQQSEEEGEGSDEDPVFFVADFMADCEAQDGMIHWDNSGTLTCVLPPIDTELEEALERLGLLAPSQPKNAFLLDRVTLEQLDPAALEAQLDTWRAESDGSTLYLRSIALLESVLATRRPDKTHLLPNYPNPFNPETWIPYHLATPSQVEITIYDTRGTVVRHLDLGHQEAGYYTSRSRAVYWDGCNDIGEKVSSGIYFYQLQTDRTSLLRKMLILK